MRLVVALSVLLFAGCGGGSVSGIDQQGAAPLQVSSPDLAGGTFPREFTCDGADRAPRLEWGATPSGTQELAVEMLDPDAPGGTFTHWLVYGIPPDISGLTAAVPAGAREGTNDFGRRGYGGPCPPRGSTHQYRLILPGLHTPLGLAARATRTEPESPAQGDL